MEEKFKMEQKLNNENGEGEGSLVKTGQAGNKRENMIQRRKSRVNQDMFASNQGQNQTVSLKKTPEE